jgi:hypothetical protein
MALLLYITYKLLKFSLCQKVVENTKRCIFTKSQQKSQKSVIDDDPNEEEQLVWKADVLLVKAY